MYLLSVGHYIYIYIYIWVNLYVLSNVFCHLLSELTTLGYRSSYSYLAYIGTANYNLNAIVANIKLTYSFQIATL